MIPKAVVLSPEVNIILYSAVSVSNIAADTKKYAPSRGVIPNSESDELRLLTDNLAK